MLTTAICCNLTWIHRSLALEISRLYESLTLFQSLCLWFLSMNVFSWIIVLKFLVVAVCFAFLMLQDTCFSKAVSITAKQKKRFTHDNVIVDNVPCCCLLFFYFFYFFLHFFLSFFHCAHLFLIFHCFFFNSFLL